MGLKNPHIVLVDFNVLSPLARTRYALVVIEGQEFSMAEVYRLYEHEKSNPSRICWLQTRTRDAIEKGVEVMQNRYRRAKRKIPEPLLNETYVLL